MVAGQKTPDGYYTLDRMLKSFARHGGHIACCGTRLDARGLTEDLRWFGAAVLGFIHGLGLATRFQDASLIAPSAFTGQRTRQTRLRPSQPPGG